MNSNGTIAFEFYVEHGRLTRRAGRGNNSHYFVRYFYELNLIIDSPNLPGPPSVLRSHCSVGSASDAANLVIDM